MRYGIARWEFLHGAMKDLLKKDKYYQIAAVSLIFAIIATMFAVFAISAQSKQARHLRVATEKEAVVVEQRLSYGRGRHGRLLRIRWELSVRMDDGKGEDVHSRIRLGRFPPAARYDVGNTIIVWDNETLWDNKTGRSISELLNRAIIKRNYTVAIFVSCFIGGAGYFVFWRMRRLGNAEEEQALLQQKLKWYQHDMAETHDFTDSRELYNPDNNNTQPPREDNNT